MNEQEWRNLIRESVRDGVLEAHAELDETVPVENFDDPQRKLNEFLRGLFFNGKYRPQ